MQNMLLTTENLTKTYHNQNAVENLSISIPENTIYGLLGPNGAGKSTTLKMITGIIKPSSGKIFYKDNLWQRKDLYEIGALIENAPLYGNLTAYENLLVRSIALSIPKARINEVLSMVDLTSTGKKKAKQFSMGMKQRLGIALALLNHPKLLILDEPTNGLDPIGIQSLRKLICSFPAQGITVILSSHILSEVENMVDEIGIIANGELGYQGAVPDSTKSLEELFIHVASSNTISEVK